jgi:hypothetical protein
MSKTRRIVIVVGILGLGILLLVFAGHRSQSRQRLQRYKAELRAKSEKLTFRELTAGQQQNTNLFAYVLTNAVAHMGQPRLIPGALELRKAVAPGRAAVSWKLDQPWNSVSAQAARVTWEDFAAEIDAVKEPLEQIRKAAEDPPAGGGPVTNLFAGPSIRFVALRTASQWLMAAAIRDLHERRLEDGLKNLEALGAMARVNREDCFLVSQMIRVAITGMGVAATWEALAADGWTDSQLERLQKIWEAVPLIDGLEKGILGERAVGGDIWELLHDSRRAGAWKDVLGQSSKPGLENFGASHILFPLYKFTSIDDDELFHLSTMQGAVESVRLLERRHPRTEAKQQFDQFGAKISSAFGSPFSRLRYWFSGMTIPNCTRAFEMALRNETDRQLLVTAIAIRRYQLRYGHAPANIESLSLEFLAAVPYDPMSGKELGYRLNGQGGFALYSVGEDGKDDGGSVVPLASTNKFGFWETKDAVWPVPAN